MENILQDYQHLLDEVIFPNFNKYITGEDSLLSNPYFPIFLSCFIVFLTWFSLMGFSLATWPSKNTFGPKQNFFLLNTIEVLKNEKRLVAWMTDMTLQKYPTNTWQFRVLNMPKYFVITTPENCEYVLKTNFENYGKGPVWYNNFIHLLGNGIFNTDGPLWYHQRKVAAHMFKQNSFKGFMLNAIKDKCKNLINIIETKRKTQENDIVEIDISDYYFRFTLDSIGEIAFGQDLRSLYGENESFMRAFDYCQQYTSALFFLPLPQFLMNRFTAAGRKYMRCIQVIQDFSSVVVGKAVEEAVKEIEEKKLKKQDSGLENDEDAENPQRADILSLFLKQGIPELQGYDARHGNKKNKATAEERETLRIKPVSSDLNYHDLKFLQDTILNFVIAGRDTTAQALSWMTYMLSERKDIQERMLEEVKEIFGDALCNDTNASEEEKAERSKLITYDNIQKCNYIHCVVLETLRLYPSVPKDGKWSYKKDTLPDGTHIPANSWIIFVPFAMGRNPAIWGKDATRFRPERFAEKYSGKSGDDRNQSVSAHGVEETKDFDGQVRHDHCAGFVMNDKLENLQANDIKVKNESDTKFTAFQAGKRICLGQKLALMEAKLVIAAVVANYEISLVKGQNIEPVWDSTTLPMQNGLKVQLKRRKFAK